MSVKTPSFYARVGLSRQRAAAVVAHLPGKHDQDSHGDGIGVDVPSVPAGPSKADDKLGLAGRIRLEPGERLVASREVDVSDSSDLSMVAAMVAAGGVPDLRVGVVEPDDAKRWSAGNKGGTARFDGAAIEVLSGVLDGEMAKGQARQDEARGKFAQIDVLEKRYQDLRVDAKGRRDPDTFELADEDRAKIDAVRAELDPLYAWQESFEADAQLAEGVVPGSSWGDLAYEVWGSDDGDGGWHFVFAVKPHGGGPDTDGGLRLVLDSGDVASWQRRLAGWLGKAQKTGDES